MDNITHSLVGAALGEAGLKRRTALGTATLVIGANFPDVDAIAYFFKGNGIHWRRGDTHGILALVVLPFVLAGLMYLYDRRVRLRRDSTLRPADYRQLCLLSAASMWTHPTLDYMNSYGMRWFMPFADKWFYGDGLFIVDPWLLIALGIGFFWSRRTGRTGPARAAFVFLTVYTVGMLVVTDVSRRAVDAAHPGARRMAQPVAVVPWERNIVVDLDSVYWVGSWTPSRGLSDGHLQIKGDNGPEVAAAKRDREAARFLAWARFPYYKVSTVAGQTIVTIVDLRYDSQWASITVTLPPAR